MLTELLRPRAIFSHALVLTVVVGCVVLGQWQLDRLGEVRGNNERLAARIEAEPLDLTAFATRTTVDDGELEFRRASATGVYRPDEEVLQRNRSHQGQSGFHVLTPLETSAGAVVLVRRGWIPAELDEPPVSAAAPPSGTVEVTGLLERPVPQPSFGASDPDDGVLERVFHTDTERLDAQIDGDLFPMVLRMETQDPPSGGSFRELPLAVERPVLDEANHLSYALQWHSFALIALVTYAAWWRSRGRRGIGPGTDAVRPVSGVGSAGR